MTSKFLCWTTRFHIFKSIMSSALLDNINDFKFSECKLIQLPVEKIKDNYVRRYIKGVVFSYVNPTPLSNPRLVSYSEDALVSILDIDPNVTKNQDFVNFISGNKILSTSTPLAHRYGGHQFGNWASQLGDGRAILLGQYINKKNETWELQLKGSGMTPYSRDGDGRAVLRSSIREYLCSEAMHYLGIPTSRAAALIVSDDQVIRDLLYDEHPNLEPTSVLLRLAPSWFRIGSLEILTKFQEFKLLSELVDFIIKNYFPMIVDDENKVFNFFKQVCRLTSDLTVAWQTVGFTHGVLNTDNISLNGVTIDYGPFGFMEDYNLMYVPNHSDHSARYCYGNQIYIMVYNLKKLAHAIAPLLDEEQLMNIEKTIQDEENYMKEKLEEEFSKKLGLNKPTELVDMLFTMLNETKADFVMTFREMSENPIEKLIKPSEDMWALSQLAKHNSYKKFIKMYQETFTLTGKTDQDRIKEMSMINPCYTLRNWMAEDAIKAAHLEDFSKVQRLLRVLKKPFIRQEEADTNGYAAKPPVWSKKICLSCSS